MTVERHSHDEDGGIGCLWIIVILLLFYSCTTRHSLEVVQNALVKHNIELDMEGE